MEKGNYVSAIKHLGHCVQSFLKEGCEEEYVKSCGNMGMALYHLELPYSAEAYLVKQHLSLSGISMNMEQFLIC